MEFIKWCRLPDCYGIDNTYWGKAELHVDNLVRHLVETWGLGYQPLDKTKLHDSIGPRRSLTYGAYQMLH